MDDDWYFDDDDDDGTKHGSAMICLSPPISHLYSDLVIRRGANVWRNTLFLA